jgi:hypothetical protein
MGARAIGPDQSVLAARVVGISRDTQRLGSIGDHPAINFYSLKGK